MAICNLYILKPWATGEDSRIKPKPDDVITDLIEDWL